MQKQNETDFQRFHMERRANEIKEVTLEGYQLTLSRLDAFLKKSFREASKDDIMAFFTMLQNQLEASTVHTWKARVKTFYNWLFELAPREYPDCVKWLHVSNPRGMSKTKGYSLPLKPEDVLTREDILKLIEACDHPRDQALISVMYETACEPMEALHMKVSNVMFDQYGGRVTLEGNQGARTIRIVDSIPYLTAWLNVHPFRKSEEAPLWLIRRGGSGRLGYSGLWRLCQKLKRRSGLKKPLRPNYLRHASLTEWAKVLPEQKLKKLAGWSPASRMAAIYVHLAGKDLDDDILKAKGKEPIEDKSMFTSVLKPKECPRCKHDLAPTWTHCPHCGLNILRGPEFDIQVMFDNLLRDREEMMRLWKKYGLPMGVWEEKSSSE